MDGYRYGLMDGNRYGPVGHYDTDDKQLALIKAAAWGLIEVPPIGVDYTPERAYLYNVLDMWSDKFGLDHGQWYSVDDLAGGARVILEHYYKAAPQEHVPIDN